MSLILPPRPFYPFTNKGISRGAWKLQWRFLVRGTGAASSADLGDSSKYSNENFED